MRRAVLFVLAACGSQDPAGAIEPRTFTFGPYDLAPGQELNGQCVSATLDNDEPLYINRVELTTGAGFHHSNWFWVPERKFPGPDGTWRCGERDYDESVAGIEGGVLFAQSTQAQHEIQAFEDGVAIVIPRRSKIVAGTHLLNPSDAATSVPLALTITPIAEPRTLLAGMAFQNQGILLPPARRSRFTLECDLETAYANLGQSLDFRVYYVLPHYHELGTGITLDAVRADGSATPVFDNPGRAGEALGLAIAPAFGMAGYSKLRFSCNYDNPGSQPIGWGNGDGEMCVFLAFIDSTHHVTGGVLAPEPAVTMTDHGDFIEYTHDCVELLAPANR